MSGSRPLWQAPGQALGPGPPSLSSPSTTMMVPPQTSSGRGPVPLWSSWRKRGRFEPRSSPAVVGAASQEGQMFHQMANASAFPWLGEEVGA